MHQFKQSILPNPLQFISSTTILCAPGIGNVVKYDGNVRLWKDTKHMGKIWNLFLLAMKNIFTYHFIFMEYLGVKMLR
jgi:hypothetical protein